MNRPSCEQHYTPARDNQYRATARYYKDACPYCEIERLKAELEDAKDDLHRAVSANSLYNQQASNLERQLSETNTANLAIRAERDQAVAQLHAELAEARAEVEALTDCLNGSRKATYTADMYDKGVAQARQEAAREIIQYIEAQGMIDAGTVARPTLVYEIAKCDIAEIKTRFKLEGVRDE